MRVLLKAKMPVEAGNAAIREGRLPKLIDGTIEQLKPEASYFYADGGKRCMLLVFDLKDPSQLPALTERLFGEANAEIEMSPVMNLEDLRKGLGQLGTKR
jgi:hypothetical protein